MKHTRIVGMLLISTMMAVLTISTASAKPAPPENLLEIFEEFSELEEKFESVEWNAALDTTKEIRKEVEELVPVLKESGSVLERISKLSAVLEKIEVAIEKKNEEKTHKFYIVLQEMFLDVMDSFDYKVPPRLTIIDNYIGEALEAFEKGNLEDVGREVDEVREFYEDAEKDLAAKGASPEDLKGFKECLHKVEEGITNSNSAQLEEHLTMIAERSKGFLSLY